MNLKLLPVVVISLLFGIGLGCIPVLNTNLHYNIWYFIPVSGILFGALLGFVQYFFCYLLNVKTQGTSFIILLLSSVTAYFLIDYGIFISTVVEITGVKELPDGQYKISQLYTFVEFLKYRLGSSSIGYIFGPDVQFIKLAGTGTKISYFIDFIGVAFGAFAIIYYFSGKHPYCDHCHKFKKSEKTFKLFFNSKSSKIDQILSEINLLAKNSSFEETTSFFEKINSENLQNKGDIKLTIDQRSCPMCKETSIVGRVFKKDAYEWKSLDDLNFSFNLSN